MRQPRFERGSFGSGGGTGQRSPMLAGVVSGPYGAFAPAGAGKEGPRCYHCCYHRLSLSVHLDRLPAAQYVRRRAGITDVARHGWTVQYLAKYPVENACVLVALNGPLRDRLRGSQ